MLPKNFYYSKSQFNGFYLTPHRFSSEDITILKYSTCFIHVRSYTKLFDTTY